MPSTLLKHALVVSLFIALGVSTQAIARKERPRFTPFTSATLPQHAIGDFDGDGQLDVANIDPHGLDHSDISITLSGSRDVVRLDASVAALIEGDVDHDGDLDLLATTRSGDILIYVNDGHGQFTRRTQSSAHTLSGQPALQSHDGQPLVTAITTAPALHARVHRWRAMVALAIRPPTDSHVITRPDHLFPPLRAPPVLSL